MGKRKNVINIHIQQQGRSDLPAAIKPRICDNSYHRGYSCLAEDVQRHCHQADHKLEQVLTAMAVWRTSLQQFIFKICSRLFTLEDRMSFETVPVTAVIPKNSARSLFEPHYTEGHSKCHNGTPGYFHLL